MLVILPVAKTTVPVSLDSQRKNIGVCVPLVSLVHNVNMVSCSWKKLSFYTNNQRFVNRNQARAVLCHFLRQCIKRLRSEHFKVLLASRFNWSVNCHTISNAISSNFCSLCPQSYVFLGYLRSNIRDCCWVEAVRNWKPFFKSISTLNQENVIWPEPE